MRVLEHAGSLRRAAVCDRVDDRGEGADDRVASDVRNDGRGTAIAALLAHAPDAIRGDRGANASLVLRAGAAIV